MSALPGILGLVGADRLLATLLVLQRRGRVTAAQLAQELEVSLATARRDLQALSTAGVPVYPQPGRGGGWQLVGGARTDLTGLTSAEAQALSLVLGPTTGTVPALASALRKLIRALPEPFRDEAQAATDAVVTDPERWGGRPGARPETLEVLQDAVVRRRQACFTYPGREGRERVVDPYGLVDKDGVWYLVAGTEDGDRTFRLDRMAAVRVSGLQSTRPPDYDLSQHWAGVVREVERRRSTVSATVLAPARLLPVLRALFGQHCRLLAPEDDGRLRIRVAAHMAQAIAETLAGLGNAVQVVEPAEVRTELARLGAELVGQYRPDPPARPRSDGRPGSEADPT